MARFRVYRYEGTLTGSVSNRRLSWTRTIHTDQVPDFIDHSGESLRPPILDIAVWPGATAAEDELFVTRGLCPDALEVVLEWTSGAWASVEPPDLPNITGGWAARVSGETDTSSAPWLGSSGWVFANAPNRYRRPRSAVLPGEPQIAFWEVDFGALGVAAADQVWLLTIITSLDDPVTATERSVRALVTADRRVALRRARVVPPVTIT